MLNTLSMLLCLLSAFLGADRYYLHYNFMAALPLYAPTALSFLGMVLGFIGVKRHKSKKKRRAPMTWAVLNLIVCLIVTGLLLAEAALGWRITFGNP